jgi:hypothetical protein
MDEEHVQEHILTGGIVAPVGGASPTHSWPLTAISLGVVASYRQMAKKLVLTCKSVPQIVGRKPPGSTSSIIRCIRSVSMSCPAIAFEQQPRNTDGAHHSVCGIVVIAGLDTASPYRISNPLAADRESGDAAARC